MERLVVTDLQTNEPVVMQYSKPCIVLFFTLKEILLIKEVNKDIQNTLLTAVSVYIGDEQKKVFLWRQKEQNCMPTYYGGIDLKGWKPYQIDKLPWVFLINNNQIFFSGDLASVSNPIIKSLLKKFPEYKTLKKSKKRKQKVPEPPKNPDKIDKIIHSDLSTDEKIEALENISSQSVKEIQDLRKELEARDKTIKDILYKM